MSKDFNHDMMPNRQAKHQDTAIIGKGMRPTSAVRNETVGHMQPHLPNGCSTYLKDLSSLVAGQCADSHLSHDLQDTNTNSPGNAAIRKKSWLVKTRTSHVVGFLLGL